MRKLLKSTVFTIKMMFLFLFLKKKFQNFFCTDVEWVKFHQHFIQRGAIHSNIQSQKRESGFKDMPFKHNHNDVSIFFTNRLLCIWTIKRSSRGKAYVE